MDPNIIATLVAALLGGGGIAAFTNYRKASKEADDIAAQTLIAVNKELRLELERRDNEIAGLRERIAVLESKLAA